MPNRLFQTPERSQWLAVAFPISKMIPLHMNNTFKDTSAFDTVFYLPAPCNHCAYFKTEKLIHSRDCDCC